MGIVVRFVRIGVSAFLFTVALLFVVGLELLGGWLKRRQAERARPTTSASAEHNSNQIRLEMASTNAVGSSG
jgi:hypothetical protein